MNPMAQISGSSAAESALAGMQRSRASLQAAADEVVTGTVQALNGASGTSDTVTLSDAAKQVAAGSLEHGMVQANTARLTYSMNVAVVRAADEQFQDMLDIAVPASAGGR